MFRVQAATKRSSSEIGLRFVTGRYQCFASRVTRGGKDDEDQENRFRVSFGSRVGLRPDLAARKALHTVPDVPHHGLVGNATRCAVRSPANRLSSRGTAQNPEVCQLPCKTPFLRTEPDMHVLPSGHSQVRARSKLHALSHRAVMENNGHDPASPKDPVSARRPPCSARLSVLPRFGCPKQIHRCSSDMFRVPQD